MSEAIKVLKAYHVQGSEYGIVRFATSNVVARREGAQELEDEFNEVSCKRMPAADKYADQGRVPVRALVEEFGWWQECAWCNSHVDDETEGRVWEDDAVFCDVRCEAGSINYFMDNEAARKLAKEAEQAAIDTAHAKFPGITDVTAYTGHKKTITLYFRFPGGKERASWDLDGEFVGTTQADSEPLKAYLASIRKDGAV